GLKPPLAVTSRLPTLTVTGVSPPAAPAMPTAATASNAPTAMTSATYLRMTLLLAGCPPIGADDPSTGEAGIPLPHPNSRRISRTYRYRQQMASPATTIEASGREGRISNPERVIFPATARTPGLSKLDIARYYVAVGDGIMR